MMKSVKLDVEKDAESVKLDVDKDTESLKLDVEDDELPDRDFGFDGVNLRTDGVDFDDEESEDSL